MKTFTVQILDPLASGLPQGATATMSLREDLGSARLPETVAVHHPSDPDVMMLINKSDLTTDHVPWGHYSDDGWRDDAGCEDDRSTELRVAKGPRGKWYVKRGKENIAGPFETEDAAMDEMTKPGA